jgi:hypothetical protein
MWIFSVAVIDITISLKKFLSLYFFLGFLETGGFKTFPRGLPVILF